MESKTRETSFAALVDKYDNFIFDCDGVLWIENHLIGDSMGVLKKLLAAGKKVFFVTNASRCPREGHQEKFKQFNHEVPVEHIYNSSYLSAQYFKRKHPEIKHIYVVGHYGITTELTRAGIKCSGSDQHNDAQAQFTSEDMLTDYDPSIQAVVAGMDSEINFYKMSYALRVVQEGGKFFCTNHDATSKAGDFFMPGGGSIVAALEFSIGRKAQILGKPNPFGFELIKEEHNCDPARTLMIGDRIDTDIMFGNNAGIDTLLVMTGVTTEKIREEVLNSESGIKPTYVTESINTGEF